MKAFVFPGQGSQYPGMGEELAKSFPEAAAVFEEADDVLGFSVSKLCFAGPEAELKLTENTQPALLTVSVAVSRVLASRGVVPEVLAGHSLGEYSALVASGSLSFADAIRLVRNRGLFMQEAVPVGIGSMAAIIGMDLQAVEEICKSIEAGSEGSIVSPANENSPGQVVISGHVDAVAAASEIALEKGASRAIPLQVSAPFHCGLMKYAEEKMSTLLDNTEFRELEVPLINNVDAEAITTGDQAREGLKRQICSMVKWTDTIRKLKAMGVSEAVEAGPGRVLAGLFRKTDRDIKTSSIEKPEQVEKYVGI